MSSVRRIGKLCYFLVVGSLSALYSACGGGSDGSGGSGGSDGSAGHGGVSPAGGTGGSGGSAGGVSANGGSNAVGGTAVVDAADAGPDAPRDAQAGGPVSDSGRLWDVICE